MCQKYGLVQAFPIITDHLMYIKLQTIFHGYSIPARVDIADIEFNVCIRAGR